MAMLETPSDGTKIRLTLDSSPQAQLLPLDLVRQRPVKEGSKCGMHNGTCFQSDSRSVTMITSSSPRITFPDRHTHIYSYTMTAPIVNGRRITSRL